jgi:hypothetical protein
MLQTSRLGKERADAAVEVTSAPNTATQTQLRVSALS